MHTEKLPSGLWRATVRYGGERRRTPALPTEREAKIAGARLLTALADEVGPVRRRRAASTVTVAELVDRHIDQSVYSPTTADEVARARRRIPADYLSLMVAEVTPADIDDLYSDLRAAGIAPGGVRRVHELLSPAFNRAERLGWVRSNPCRVAAPPPVARPPVTVPSPAVLGRLVDAVDGDAQFGAFLRLAWTSGARRGELVALRWDDIDLEAGRLSIDKALVWTKTAGIVEKSTKTKGRRVVALDPATVAAVRRWKLERGTAHLALVGGDCYVFGLGDRPRRPDWATQRWVRLRANVVEAERVAARRERRKPDPAIAQVRLHDLRHFSASELIGAGVDVVTVAGRLGHANPRTTLAIYAHASPERDRAAADVIGRALG